MAAKTHYERLEVDPAAAADEIKRAFRQLIARYHPDKVQHLGQEFQEIAATRAAELTEAYRVLSHAGLRAEYDRELSAGGAAVGAPPPPPSAVVEPSPVGPAAEPEAGGHGHETFSRERAGRDDFVRRAAIARLREALEATAGNTYDEAQVRGFDLACTPRPRMFGRGKAPRLLGRFVGAVDAAAVRDTWSQAVRWAAGGEDVCVLLLGSRLAPARELAGAIADQRTRTRTAKLTLVPVDARDWDAHIPVDAPPVARNVIAWLQDQSGLGNKWR